MKVTLVDGPAAGRVFDVPDMTYTLTVPYIDPEDEKRLTAMMFEADEVEDGIPITHEGPTFRVAEYQRANRWSNQMYCIRPAPKERPVAKCPSCGRPF